MYHSDRGRSALAWMALGAALLWGPMAQAETAPRSSIASSDVYKVVAEANGLRVVIATWRPGQRDQWHSHPVSAFYWLTDCDARIYSPDGQFRDFKVKAGMTGVQAPIESHSLENRSTEECRILMVERE
jgi:hypothetical protein